MRILRLLLAGLIGVTVLVAGLFAAVLVVITGLVGYLMQLLRGKPIPSQPARAPNRRSSMRADDVIDV